MPTTSPRLVPLQGVLRRVVYVALYEGLAIAFVTIAFVAGDQSLGSARGGAGGSSLIAGLWDLVFNAAFERWESRQRVRGRSRARRLAHAIGFEGGLALWLVPFMAWWLEVGLWQALLLDLGLLLFFLAYTFVFTWVFDRLFGLPRAAA